MNRSHLGDALDFWKGGLIGWLRPAMRSMRVVPMFTDPNIDDWSSEHIALYARLLGVRPASVLHAGVRFTHARREEYFSSMRIPVEADLFFDPDNGISDGRRANARHVTHQELERFVPSRSDRVIIVYQHARRERDYPAKTLARICRAIPGAEAIAYRAGQVALIILSRDLVRVDRIRDTLIHVPQDLGRVINHGHAPPSAP